MVKVSFFNKRLFGTFLQFSSIFLAFLSGAAIFINIPECYKIITGIAVLLLLLLIYFGQWWRANNLQDIRLNIDGSTVNIKTGDIFLQPGLKAIAFNEYLDTEVDDKLIAKRSLNGIFLEQHLEATSIAELDQYINEYSFGPDDILDTNYERKVGKRVRYKSGTICVYKDFLITAFAKFDESNRANLTMPEYLEFLITFWDNVNRVYAQKNVSTTIFGSGITRIKGHKNISDEDLLKIMLWTFRISEMRFKYPAKLTIIIHTDKIGQINLFDIKAARNGL